jgi:TolB protein
MNSDGGDQAQLYPPTLQSTGYKTGVFTTATIHPSWSPDRRHIAFANAGDIWVLNANGDVKDITKNTPALKQDSPAWSPDGRRIAYGQYTTGSCTPVCERIYVMNADGSHPVGLNTASGEWADWAPSWSPDGKRIAYASNKGDTGEEQENIWVMNANGSDAHRVTHLRGWNIRPAWSPDGKWIAFESDANSSDFANCDKADQCRYNIAVVDAAGRQRPHLVTSLTDPTSDMFPAWISPTRLLFTANDVSNPQVNTSGNIWAIDLSGKNLKKITTDGSSQWAAPAR